MFFTEVSAQEFMNSHCYKHTKVMQFVQEFINANIPVAAVGWQGEYANVASCQSVITQAAKRLKTPHIKAVSRDGRVFIYNELLLKDLRPIGKEEWNGTQEDS